MGDSNHGRNRQITNRKHIYINNSEGCRMLTSEQVKEVLNELDTDANIDAIGDNDMLSKCGIDSLDMFNVFLRLEEITGKKVPDDDVYDLETIASILEYFN